MMIYGGLHPKSDVDGLYVKRKKGGRGLVSVERCIRGSLLNGVLACCHALLALYAWSAQVFGVLASCGCTYCSLSL